MNFASEDERGGSGSRGGARNIVAGLGGVGSGGGGSSGSNGREKYGVATLATLDVGTRASPALPYGKIVSLPAAGGGMGPIRGRYER